MIGIVLGVLYLLLILMVGIGLIALIAGAILR